MILHLLVALSTLLPPANSGRAGPGFDVLDKFRPWLVRLQQGRETIESRPAEEVQAMFGDLRTLWAMDPSRGTEIAGLLLDFLGWCATAADIAGPESRAQQMRELAIDAVRAHVDPEFVRWITREVVAMRSQPVERRIAALEILAKDHANALLLPLLSVAKEDEPRIRTVALEMLVGWDDANVHAMFLDELERGLEGRGGAASWLAEAHFKKVVLAPQSPFAGRLEDLVKKGLSSPNWREVSRAVLLSRPLDAERIVPFLIEALAQWKARDEGGAQALRVELEIVRTLENRSGRKLGPSPPEWSKWWRAMRRGEIHGSGPATGRYQEGTRAAFFGIHPGSDRVTFVIDRSGSMQTALKETTGESRRTRWDRAVAELLGCLGDLGPRARFGLILFHDHPEEWRPTLQDANDENRLAARRWLEGTHPGGGTALQGAIARAMRIQPDGLPDLAVLEADTVIVLCDGETNEGSGWVEPFLRTANMRARIVFHCVQVGVAGDGTLEKLASGSGGDFVHVDG